MENQFQIVAAGTSVQTQDFNLLGTVSGHQDDYVLHELFHTPSDGNGYQSSNVISRAIVPYAPHGDFYQNPTNGVITGQALEFGGTVIPSNQSNASVLIRPFRAILGSRTPLGSGTELQNYRDIRSTVFCSSGTSTQYQQIQLTSNSSGNPRWDLVYAAVSPDVSGTSTTRNIKNPTTGVIAVNQTVVQTLVTGITIGTVVGTPAASPALPSIPADGGGVYYIPLAYVRVPTGFTATSIIPRSAVCGAASTASLSRITGVSSYRPASSISDPASVALGARMASGWGSTGTRPGWTMPLEMVGKKTLLIYMDFTSGTSSNWSHQNGTIVDDKQNWAGHIFRYTAYIGNAANSSFATDIVNGPSTQYIIPGSANTYSATTMVMGGGQTMVADPTPTVANMSMACYFGSQTYGLQAQSTTLVGTSLSAGNTFGIGVVQPGVTSASSPGSHPLVASVTGTPGCKAFIILEAFGPFANYGV